MRVWDVFGGGRAKETLQHGADVLALAYRPDGQELAVALHAYLRPEQKFSGLDELKSRIAADAAQARQILDAILAARHS